MNEMVMSQDIVHGPTIDAEEEDCVFLGLIFRRFIIRVVGSEVRDSPKGKRKKIASMRDDQAESNIPGRQPFTAHPRVLVGALVVDSPIIGI